MSEMFRPKNAEEQRIYMLGVIYGQEEAEDKIERLIKAGDILHDSFESGMCVAELEAWEAAKND